MTHTTRRRAWLPSLPASLALLSGATQAQPPGQVRQQLARRRAIGDVLQKQFESLRSHHPCHRHESRLTSQDTP
jgi:hypothetical protein